MGEADDADEDDGDERDQARHLSARCPQGCQGFPNQGRPFVGAASLGWAAGRMAAASYQEV